MFNTKTVLHNNERKKYIGDIYVPYQLVITARVTK